jgi:hypothetical protein
VWSRRVPDVRGRAQAAGVPPPAGRRAEAERVAAGVTAERIAQPIAARPAQVAALLDGEERRGRC